jgi:hypothetical protein
LEEEMAGTPLGPNAKELIIERMAQMAVPSGGGVNDALSFLSDSMRIVVVGRDAAEWVRQAISVMKAAPDNPYGDDDEAIAGEILRQLHQRREQKTVRGYLTE